MSFIIRDVPDYLIPFKFRIDKNKIGQKLYIVTQKKIHKNVREKNVFYFNHDVTKLHHISLVKVNFYQDESDRRAGIKTEFTGKNGLSKQQFL